MLLPLLPEWFAGEVAWDPGDFMFLGILLVGVAYELAARVPDRSAYRAAVAIALAAAFLNSWINLAVGIIGSEDNPANWIYAGVIAVAVVGAVLARFRPLGMARVMVATAIAQALAIPSLPCIALFCRFAPALASKDAAVYLPSSAHTHRIAGRPRADLSGPSIAMRSG